MRTLRENNHKKENRRRKEAVKEDRLWRVILGVQVERTQRVRAVTDGGKGRKGKTFYRRKTMDERRKR